MDHGLVILWGKSNLANKPSRTAALSKFLRSELSPLNWFMAIEYSKGGSALAQHLFYNATEAIARLAGRATQSSSIICTPTLSTLPEN